MGCSGSRPPTSRDIPIDSRGAVIKPWGVSHELSRGSHKRRVACVGVSGYTSMHRHALLANGFFVLDGVIDIEIETLEPQYIRLNPGESYLVLPNEWHRFIVVEPAIFIETYYSNCDEPEWNDIIRRDESSGEPYKP